MGHSVVGQPGQAGRSAPNSGVSRTATPQTMTQAPACKIGAGNPIKATTVAALWERIAGATAPPAQRAAAPTAQRPATRTV